jgi:hypothetical protein
VPLYNAGGGQLARGRPKNGALVHRNTGAATNALEGALKKRILTFGLLGPVLSYLVFIALSREHAALLAKSVWLVLPATFAVVGVPLLLCGLLDFFMDKARWWERLIVALLSGFVLTLIVVFAIWPSLAKVDWPVLQLGAVGALPSVICSWIASLSIPRKS